MSKEEEAYLAHGGDWFLTLVAMFGSGVSGTPNRRGARIGDAAKILNAPFVQLELALRMAALHREARIIVQEPSGASAIIAKTFCAYPALKSGWALEPDCEGGSQLTDLVHDKLGESCVEEIDRCFIFLDLGLESSTVGDFGKQNLLIPSSLQDIGTITFQERESSVRIEQTREYGRNFPTEGEIENVSCFESCCLDDAYVRVYAEGKSTPTLSCARPLRLYPRDSQNRRLSTFLRGDDEIVIDLAERSGPRTTTYRLVRVASSEDHAPRKNVDAPFAEIDYWDLPPSGQRPTEYCTGQYEGVPYFLNEPVQLRFRSFRNVLARTRQLQLRPGAYEERDDAAYYKTETAYSEGELQRFILSFGSDCTVLAPECLRLWHVEGALDRLERLASLL